MIERAETYEFQAETRQLLHLMVHSLYTTKDIFLRELISNASDALDRLRFDALMRPELTADAAGAPLEIRLSADRGRRLLTVSDNGLGMSRDEVVANIGTIARSGTREARELAREGAEPASLAELIGQFGVGFYSSFMVADKVSLVTRRAGEEAATLWESSGDGRYTLAETSKLGRGTSITLHLKPHDPENGIEDYTDEWVLARIVRRYSDFIGYPVVFVGEGDGEGGGQGVDDTGTRAGSKVLNSMKPLWTRPASEVTAAEYSEFYKHISGDFGDPLHVVTAKAEGLLEYQALVFIPSTAPRDLYYHAAEWGLRLYAKSVLIKEKCPELLPQYLRFVRGVVDSADLPLNISRQTLQQDRQIGQIRKWLTKKVLDALRAIFESDRRKYLLFWEQFGRALKEGVSSDYENKDAIVPLLLFASSADPEKLTTLEDYVGRIKQGQQEIFHLTGESREVIENSPHLEAFREKGYEVLYLTEPVDELVVGSLPEFQGRRLKAVGKGKVRLGSGEEAERAEGELRKQEEESAALLQAIQRHLDQHVKEVRLTNRLTSSPVCLVVSELDYSPQLERLLQAGKGGRPAQRRIMELNPSHELFVKLREHFGRSGGDAVLARYAELLFGYALTAEGAYLPDPARFNSLLVELMVRGL